MATTTASDRITKRECWWIIGAVVVALLASTWGAWSWMNRLPDDETLRRMLVGEWIEEESEQVASNLVHVTQLGSDGSYSESVETRTGKVRRTRSETFHWSVADGELLTVADGRIIQKRRITILTPDRIHLRWRPIIDWISPSAVWRSWHGNYTNTDTTLMRYIRPAQAR